ELAQVFARFGSQVTIIEGADRILPPEEPEASQIVTDVLTAEGITIHTGQFASSVSHDGSEFTVTVGDKQVRGQRLLVATGRGSNAPALGADVLGVELQRGFLPVDDHMQVVPGVYAVGDIAGQGAFTHMAMYQAG